MWLRINAVVWLDYRLIIEKCRGAKFIYPTPQPAYTTFSPHSNFRHPPSIQLWYHLDIHPNRQGWSIWPPTTHSNHIREPLLTKLFPPLWVPPQVSPELDEAIDNLAEYKQWAELTCLQRTLSSLKVRCNKSGTQVPRKIWECLILSNLRY